MKSSFGTLATLLGLSVAMCGTADAQKIIVGYATNWNDTGTVANTLDFSKITHLNIAFENPTDDAGDLSYNAADDALIAKAHASNVKVLVSIGGGGVSEDKKVTARYFDLQSDSKRAGFVAKLAAYVTQHNLDGLDVDLEGPSIGQDYGAFIADLSKALLPSGKLLTAAVSEGYGGDKIPNSAFDGFSFVNVMSYDGTGPWNPNKPGPHASMEMCKENVAYWLGRGLPKAKLVLGVPFYGYGFGKAFRQGDYSFNEIVTTFPGSELTDQVGETIYYNGIPTIKAKAKYVVDQGLAGMMIWCLDLDAKGDKSLLAAIYAGLHP